ncbi:hypothetical protein [Halomicrobium salinisoli]|uniref:hypothetical protein n=1 Tax=Halomicrobium salinisoli TaxID=2878391 RepID=UPI001CF09067|nr:hypothetical protein [Halomicrobium salinisoli]
MVGKRVIYGEPEERRRFLIATVFLSVILYVSPDALIEDFAPPLIGVAIVIGVIAGVFYRIGLIGCLTGVCSLITVINFKAYWFDQQTETAFGIHWFVPLFVILTATLLIGLPAFVAGVGIRRNLLSEYE